MDITEQYLNNTCQTFVQESHRLMNELNNNPSEKRLKQIHQEIKTIQHISLDLMKLKTLRKNNNNNNE